MVGSDSIMISVWIIIVALSLVSYLSPTEGIGLRQEANVCIDGTYSLDDRNCCLCSIGQRLIDHCTENMGHGKCESCVDNKTYSSHPNSQTSCEPCTQCDDNANMEVHEECERNKNTKCRCKKDHYCDDKDGPCKACYPCKKCINDGNKQTCTVVNHPVCKQEGVSGGNELIIIPCVVVAVLIILVIAAVMLWRWKKSQNINQQANGKAADVEMQPLNVPRVDLTPHLPDIADMIGWNDFKMIAMRTGISQPVIDACQLDHPNNAQQQTIQLLKNWVEQQGMDASVKLIQNLEKSGKKLTAEKVMGIL